MFRYKESHPTKITTEHIMLDYLSVSNFTETLLRMNLFDKFIQDMYDQTNLEDEKLYIHLNIQESYIGFYMKQYYKNKINYQLMHYFIDYMTLYAQEIRSFIEFTNTEDLSDEKKYELNQNYLLTKRKQCIDSLKDNHNSVTILLRIP